MLVVTTLRRAMLESSGIRTVKRSNADSCGGGCFGTSVALDGSLLLVGSREQSHTDGINGGSPVNGRVVG